MPVSLRLFVSILVGSLALTACTPVLRIAAEPSAVSPAGESAGTAPAPTPLPAPPAATVEDVPPPDPTATRSTPAPSLVGDTANAWAFAPLDQPDRIVIEGEVPSERAWSTSKVLVVAAFVAEVLGGDPQQATATQQQQMKRALAESDMDSLVALGNAIPGGKSAAMTKVLRSIGDSRTMVPGRLEGTMTWSLEEQIRFLVALNDGQVVSRAASSYLLEHMQPIESQSWGLGSIGATAYKGGWLRANTETRQMGIVDGYAVAIITRGVGPVEVQSDGDSAHVQQMNMLAARLQERLAAEG